MFLKDNFITILNESNSKINNQYANYYNDIFNNMDFPPNIIIYGPPACGKYSESLKIIEKYSLSKLKYEKKITININKSEHIIKISDIHYEINMENLTCNQKTLFNNIFTNIIDVIESSKERKGIILCKNFHFINNELLDVFYSYMQKNIFSNINIKFILLTECISFIPKNIQNICKILYFSKLSNSNYLKLANKENKKFLTSMNKEEQDNILNNINNIYILKNTIIENNKFIIIKNDICDKLVDIIINNKINYSSIRTILYDILIYNLNIFDCVEYIIQNIIKNKLIFNNFDKEFINNIFIKTCELFKHYNNNYRPIFHLESYILYLIKLYNEN